MAVFNININEEPPEWFKVKNSEINTENCKRINQSYNVQIINNSILSSNTIELLNSYSSPNNWVHMNISDITYSDESKFYLFNDTIILQEGNTYGYDVSSTNINENISNLKVVANFDTNDFSTQTITFKINFEDNYSNVYDYQYLTLVINPSPCSEGINPEVTEINIGESNCDSQYIAISVENTPYSELHMQYKTLQEGEDSYTATLEKLNSFDGSIINNTNLIISNEYRSIIHQISETGVNYYRIKICANDATNAAIPNKCSLILNIMNIQGDSSIYSYILTDKG